MADFQYQPDLNDRVSKIRDVIDRMDGGCYFSSSRSPGCSLPLQFFIAYLFVQLMLSKILLWSPISKTIQSSWKGLLPQTEPLALRESQIALRPKTGIGLSRLRRQIPEAIFDYSLPRYSADR